MKDNKYIVYDAYVSAFRNCIAFIRPLALTMLSFIVMSIVSIAFLFFAYKSAISRFVAMFQSMPVHDAVFSFFPFSLFAVAGVLFLFLIALFMAIYCNYALRIHDGDDSQKVKFPPILAVIKIMFAKFIQLIVLIPPFLLLVFPGIYWMIRTSFIEFAILDKNAGIFSAFSQSFALSKGNGWKIFAALVVSMTLLSVLPTLFIFAPVPLFALGYLYKEIGK